MSEKSVLQEAREVQLASTLIRLGARLQFLESEVSLSRQRLVRLYKEIKGVSPPKGLLPFSADWYMTWMANIHASLFYNIYAHMAESLHCAPLEALIKAYEMYLEQVEVQGGEPVLDFTRAYTLVRFFASHIVDLTTCTRCTGRFVTHAYDNKSGYVCVLCRPPSRAGKPGRGKRLSELVDAAAAQESAAESAGTTAPQTATTLH